MSSWEELEVSLCMTKELQNGETFLLRCVETDMNIYFLLEFNPLFFIFTYVGTVSLSHVILFGDVVSDRIVGIEKNMVWLSR